MATKEKYNTYTNRARDYAASKLDQDEQELLYTTMVGAIMAAIFAMNADADPAHFSGCSFFKPQTICIIMYLA